MPRKLFLLIGIAFTVGLTACGPKQESASVPQEQAAPAPSMPEELPEQQATLLDSSDEEVIAEVTAEVRPADEESESSAKPALAPAVETGLTFADAVPAVPAAVSVTDDRVEVVSGSRALNALKWTENLPLRAGQALEFSVRIDPLVDDASTADIDAGIVLGMPSSASDPNRFNEPGDKVFIEFKEFADQTRFTIMMDGQDISFWGRPRMHAGKGIPNIGTRQPGDTYLLKIVAIPRGEQTGLRFFVEHGDRPLRLFQYDAPSDAANLRGEFVVEWTLDRPLTENNYLGLYVREGGRVAGTATTVFEDLSVRYIPVELAEQWMDSDEFVMANLNYDHPDMVEVKAARDAGDMAQAKALLVDYFRTRETPEGPSYDPEMARATAHGKEANWREVSDNALAGIYSKLSWFHGFSEPGELSRENGMPLWSADPGFLNRHFHWVVLTHAWLTTGEDKYAARVGDELIDWVEMEPHFDWETEGLGGMASMDGTVITEHVLWTGNIGRRLEMTWWQMFEELRKSDAFSDEAVFAYLDGVIRQCRLLANPTIFLEWDDSGLHGAMALTKSSMLFEMADEAPLWNSIGWDRIDTVIDIQFHPDGSHASLSSGYEWATIYGFQHFYEYIKKNGGTVPTNMEKVIEDMFYHPLAITRPNFGTVDLNDGTWGVLSDRAETPLELFPHRKDYEYFATEGAAGEEPDPVSMYAPNAGQYVFRTGWGADEGHQYLFFGAGPWGASHGKHDALNIYTHYGKQLLIRNAGRASYKNVPITIHAGKSLSFNTISPDWGQENSVPHHKTDMAIGFNPPERRFVTDEHFDYGEGAFTYGWHKPGEHIEGKWVRQVVFVKGEDAKTEGYYIVVDTVEPKTDRERTWRHPWQLDTSNIELLADKSVLATTPHAALQILPVDPAGDMTVEIIKGQKEPELLGWRVYGETANPWPVPTYAWKADGTFSRAWVIQMQDKAENFPVASVQAVPSDIPGELMFKVSRRDGGADYVLRRFPGSPERSFNRESVEGDFVVISRDASDAVTARLEMTDGEDTVAKSSGAVLVKAKPNTSERLAAANSQRIGSGTAVRLENSSFETPSLEVERGTFEGWSFNSLAGTGTWPVARVGATGDADGKQVAVIHAGGFIGQTLKDASGNPIGITPGAKLRVTFRNLPIEDTAMRPINLGIYLMAGEKDGARIAEAVSFNEAMNTPGEKTVDFTLLPKSRFDETLPAGWEKIPVYLQFWNFAGRVAIDDVKVEVLP